MMPAPRLMLLLTALAACAAPAAAQTIEWSAGGRGGDGQTSVGLDVLEAADGSVINVGTIHRWGTSFGLIERVDGNGRALWERELLEAREPQFSGIIEVDGGYIVFGSSSRDSSGAFDADVLVVWLDGDGIVLRETSFTAPGNDQVTEVVRAHDGGVFLLGRREGSVSTIWRLDASMRLVWSRSYRRIAASGLDVLEDGSLLISGTSQSDTTGLVRLVRLSRDGDEVGEQTLALSFGRIRAAPIGLDGVVIVGTRATSDSTNDLCIASVDADGITRRLSVLTKPAHPYHEIGDITRLHDGSVVALSSTGNYLDERTRLEVIHIRSDGTVVTDTILDYRQFGRANIIRARATRDGGLLFTGIQGMYFPGMFMAKIRMPELPSSAPLRRDIPLEPDLTTITRDLYTRPSFIRSAASR